MLVFWDIIKDVSINNRWIVRYQNEQTNNGDKGWEKRLDNR